MLRLQKVAVTGGLSCGKSSVCRYFKELGAYVVSADEIVHQLLLPNTSVGQAVIDLLGEEIVRDGQIDRKKVASKVFNNSELLRALEQLILPTVLKEIEQEFERAKKLNNVPLFVAELPLLFEAADIKMFDATITVWATTEQCVQRFHEATGQGKDEFDKRMARQLSIEKKIQMADFVIDNSGSEEQARKAVSDLFTQLTTP